MSYVITPKNSKKIYPPHIWECTRFPSWWIEQAVLASLKKSEHSQIAHILLANGALELMCTSLIYCKKECGFYYVNSKEEEENKHFSPLLREIEKSSLRNFRAEKFMGNKEKNTTILGSALCIFKKELSAEAVREIARPRDVRSE